MSALSGIRLKSPAHPGGFFKHEVLEPLGLTVTAAAFGVSMDTLMGMQNNFDIAQVRKRENGINVAPELP